MKLLGSTKSKPTKDENGKNVPHLEITLRNIVVLLTTIISKIQGFCIHIILIS